MRGAEPGAPASRRPPRPGDPGERAGLSWMVLGAAAFASMGALGHLVGKQVDWRLVVATRTAIGAGLMVLWRPGILRRLLGPVPRALWVRSVAGTAAVLATFYALPRLPITDVITLRNSTPLWLAVMERLWLGTPAPRGTGPALACALAGVAVLEQPELAAGNLALAAALFAAVASAAAMLGLNRLGAVDPPLVVAHFSTMAACVAGGWMVLDGALPAALAPASPRLGALALVGLTGTVAQVAVTRAYALAPAVPVALTGLLQVVFAAGFDAWLHGSLPGARQLVGVAMIVGPSGWILAAARPVGDE